MATATRRASRVALDVGVRWSPSRAIPCKQRTPFSSLAIRCFNNTTPIIEGDSLPPEPPVQTPQPTPDHRGPPAERNGQSSSPLPSHTAISTLDADQRALHSRSRIRQQYPIQPPPQPHPAKSHSPTYDLHRAPTVPVDPPQHPLLLTASLRRYLPHLATQPPLYITVHIHGKPYLVTAGDTIRLPFLMHGVIPGDVLRLDRASLLGSRDWTLRAGLATEPSELTDSEREPAEPIIGKSEDVTPTSVNFHHSDPSTSQLRQRRPKSDNRIGHLDPRLFVCRATVVGVESEPMRIIEKTKRRQRKVKHVKSRLRNTILRIREVSVRPLPELERETQS